MGKSDKEKSYDFARERMKDFPYTSMYFENNPDLFKEISLGIFPTPDITDILDYDLQNVAAKQILFEDYCRRALTNKQLQYKISLPH